MMRTISSPPARLIFCPTTPAAAPVRVGQSALLLPSSVLSHFRCGWRIQFPFWRLSGLTFRDSALVPNSFALGVSLRRIVIIMPRVYFDFPLQRINAGVLFPVHSSTPSSLLHAFFHPLASQPTCDGLHLGGLEARVMTLVLWFVGLYSDGIVLLFYACTCIFLYYLIYASLCHFWFIVSLLLL